MRSLLSAENRPIAIASLFVLAILLAGTLVFAVAGFTNSLLVGVLGDHPGVLLVASLVVSLAATLVNVVAFRFWTLHDQD